MPIDIERKKDLLKIISEHGPIDFGGIKEKYVGKTSGRKKITNRMLHFDLALLVDLEIVRYDETKLYSAMKRQPDLTFASEADYKIAMKHTGKLLAYIISKDPEDSVFHLNIDDLILNPKNSRLLLQHVAFYPQLSGVTELIDAKQEFDDKISEVWKELSGREQTGLMTNSDENASGLVAFAHSAMGMKPVTDGLFSPFLAALRNPLPVKRMKPSWKPLQSYIKEGKINKDGTIPKEFYGSKKEGLKNLDMNRNENDEEPGYDPAYVEYVWDPALRIRETIGEKKLIELADVYAKTEFAWRGLVTAYEHGTPLLGHCDACPNFHVLDARN